METISIILHILFSFFLTITLLGMIKPWWVLWYLDFKNRLTVLRYYGIITLLLGLGVTLVRQLV